LCSIQSKAKILVEIKGSDFLIFKADPFEIELHPLLESLLLGKNISSIEKK